MANCTGDAILPPAPDLLTTALTKSPKKRSNLAAAVGHGATDASVTSKPRYPSRGHAGRKTSTAVGASSRPVAEDDADFTVPTEKAPLAAEKLKL